MNDKANPPDIRDSFRVDTWVHILGGLVERHHRLWIRMGKIESWFLTDALAGIPVDKPVYVTGLARSGSTILLEMLDWHPDVATHRYRDYPMLFTPYMWNRYLDRTPQNNARPMERSHRDGIFITPESPEAFEEVLWMAFFTGIHDTAISSVLDGECQNPEFESFYRDHIRKLLLARKGTRYVSKGNYNITRMEYLLRICENSRFIIPVREPVWHIASLMKQHRLFRAGQEDNPRAVAHLRRVGHFEFGIDRRPINTGDSQRVEEVRQLWENGEEVEGWARYWAHIHDFLADRLEANNRLKEAAMVVRYEDLCQSPAEQFRSILEHCGLSVPEELIGRAEERIRFPGYYRPKFSQQELDTIERLTGKTARRFGMGRFDTDPPLSTPDTR